MLDIAFIREHADLVKDAAKKKSVTVDIDGLLKVDEKRREHIQKVEKKRNEQNEMTDKISKTGGEEREKLIAAMKPLKDEIRKEKEVLDEIMEEWRTLMLQVPNVPDMEVPVGKSDADNQEVKTWGEKPAFEFEPKDHIQLMTALDMADFDRGVKVSGFRGYILKNEGLLLSMALWQFAIDQMMEQGFTPQLMPSLVRREPFMGTGYLPQSEDDLYRTQDDEYLSGTAEVPTMGSFMDETLAEKELPKKIVAFSPCFRREAGSHGKDTKGLMRVHEFYKVEQLVLCEASHEESVRFHEELLSISEKIMQRLGLPYHVVLNCTGDLGLGQVKKYDIEAWVPSEGKYRETHSCSYFHDFQTRRLNIRYTDKEGNKQYAHSLNNTAIATPRILIAIVENNQQADGSIIIPEVLQKYMNKAVIEPKND